MKALDNPRKAGLAVHMSWAGLFRPDCAKLLPWFRMAMVREQQEFGDNNSGYIVQYPCRHKALTVIPGK